MVTPTVSSLIESFPMPKLSSIADARTRPSYTTLRRIQTEINGNAASVPSDGGGGLNGHLTLTITPEAYLLLAGVAYNPPALPPAPVLPAFSSPAEVSFATRRYEEAKTVFHTYHAVDTALKHQIIKSTPPLYIAALQSTTTGFGNVTTLQLLAHLWRGYGDITQTELGANAARMAAPWNPPTPIESLYQQLQDGMEFAAAGGEPMATNTILRIGYTNIANTGLFDVGCREWRNNDKTTRTFASFQAHFTSHENDRIDTTTSSRGYHSTYKGASANHVDDTTSATSVASSQAATIAAQGVQITQLLAAFQALSATSTTGEPGSPPEPTAFHTTQDTNSVFSGITQATPGTSTAISYCWTHGHSSNPAHTSKTCNRRSPSHQELATATNTMGGSERDYTLPAVREEANRLRRDRSRNSSSP
jgi:hypothetical protein